MNAAYPQYGHPGALLNSTTGTLREALDRRAAVGQRLGLETAVSQIVPLVLELAEIHEGGYGFYLHPSSVAETADGSLVLAREMATQLPSHPRDQACLPPETQPGALNDARGNVYAIGAIFYELLTGQSVGPGMRRPAELVAGLPPTVEEVLSYALITNPQHRPDDLRALAQSFQQLNRRPSGPPASPTISYNGSQSIAIDISLSLLPPKPQAQAAAVAGVAPVVIRPVVPAPPPQASVQHQAPVRHQAPVQHQAPQRQAPSSEPPASSAVNGYGVAVQGSSVNGYGVAVQAAANQSAAVQAAQVAELRAQLESDPRPRFFVVKGGMDHGPFSAVELVRHIDGHTFLDEDNLVDSMDGRRAPIRDWPQFAQFAEHAKRSRQLVQRQKEIVKVAAADRKSSRGKTLIGLLVIVGLLGAGGAWLSATSGERNDDVAIQEDESTNVETEGSLSIKGKKGKKGARRRGAGGGNIPSVSSGQSCEAALDSYNEMKSMGEQGQADLTAGQYGRVLNGGAYFSHCGVPFSMNVSICAAVQNGRAVGVTVSTQPHDAKRVSCITSAVRGLNFPSHPKLDVTRTRFASQ